MKNYDEAVSAIVSQVKHWIKIGEVSLVDTDVVMDAADLVLSEEEYDEYRCTVIRDALWNL